MEIKAEIILHDYIDKESMDELSENVWPDMLKAMRDYAKKKCREQRHECANNALVFGAQAVDKKIDIRTLHRKVKETPLPEIT